MYHHKDGVRLRKIERQDLGQLLALKQESWWGTHKTLIVNSDDQENWFQSIPKDQLYMVAEQNYTAVGVAVYTEIDWISRSLSISGSIYANSRDRGLTRNAFSAGLDFAFEVLNMRRVSAEVLETNKTAQYLEIEHLGFKVEGRRRQAVYKFGRYWDSIILGLLRDEWESQPRVKSCNGVCMKGMGDDTRPFTDSGE